MAESPLDVTLKLIDTATADNDDNRPKLDVQALRATLGSTSIDSDYYSDQIDEGIEVGDIIQVDKIGRGSSKKGKVSKPPPKDDGKNLTSRVKQLRGSGEVLYANGATPLFKAIEEVNWREALRLVDKYPDQIRTWVKSTGTENTTFDWSFWRRLPIHEAARRQAPAWFVSALLSQYPESACEVTQFNELPLHLAVGCGASPEVVNLILVANWEGIVARDKTGRTPLEVWNESDGLLVHDDHRVVYESLTRSHKTYMTMQASWNRRMNNLKKEHEMALLSLSQQHDDEISTEKERQRELEVEVAELYGNIERIQMELGKREDKIASFAHVEKSWYERVESLNEHVATLQKEKKEEQENVEALHQILKQTESELSSTKASERALANDVKQISNWYNATDENLGQTQRNLQKMVDSYVQLHGKLMDEKDHLEKIVKIHNVDKLSQKSSGTTPRSTRRRSLQNQGIQEEVLNTSEVANAAAAAAVAALDEESRKRT